MNINIKNKLNESNFNIFKLELLSTVKSNYLQRIISEKPHVSYYTTRIDELNKTIKDKEIEKGKQTRTRERREKAMLQAAADYKPANGEFYELQLSLMGRDEMIEEFLSIFPLSTRAVCKLHTDRRRRGEVDRVERMLFVYNK